jgi:hypothetical protein
MLETALLMKNKPRPMMMAGALDLLPVSGLSVVQRFSEPKERGKKIRLSLLSLWFVNRYAPSIMASHTHHDCRSCTSTLKIAKMTKNTTPAKMPHIIPPLNAPYTNPTRMDTVSHLMNFFVPLSALRQHLNMTVFLKSITARLGDKGHTKE